MANETPRTLFLERLLTSSKLVLFLWILTIVAVIIAFILVYFKTRSGVSTVALHYNVIVGVDLLGKSKQLYLIPITSAGIALLNYLLFRFAIPKDDFLGTLAAGVSFVAALILLTALLFLSFVN